MNASIGFRGFRMLALMLLCLALVGCQGLGAGGGKLVKEVELVCPIEDMHFEVDGYDVQFWQNMENGTVGRAGYGWYYANCEEPYLKGWGYSLLDSYLYDDDTADRIGYLEIITDEGGAWKGMQECHFKDAGSYCIHDLTGDGLYEGMHAVFEYYFDTSTAKMRVTKQ